MPYVKLDCGMLDSSLWIDRLARELFITALLMAEPIELREPMTVLSSAGVPDIHFKEIPPGWYGFVPAAGPGIIRRAGIDDKTANSALDRLAQPDYQSRSPEWSGRRMVRVSGGFIILNFDKYRTKDHTAAERARRYRERQASRVTTDTSRVRKRNVTQAEAEADKKKRCAQARPTIEQVIELIGETAGRDFFDYYESNGWRVGRNPMKSWKAAAQRWKRNQSTVNAARPNFSRQKERAPSYPKMSETRECSDEERERVLKIAAEEKEKLRTSLNR